MSRENVEVVRQGLAALEQLDVEAYLKLASPRIEIFSPMSPLEGPFVGHEGVREFFSEMESFVGDRKVQVDEVRAVEPRVLASFSATIRGRTSGAETRTQLAVVYDFEGGKILCVRAFLDRAEALEAVGLSE
jgi:ketosteroid isomerase-like protein